MYVCVCVCVWGGGVVNECFHICGPHFFFFLQGYLETGAIFDSSVQAQRDPLVFMLGQRKVIPGKQFEVRHSKTFMLWSSICYP